MTPATEFILASKYFLGATFSALGIDFASAVPLVPEWATKAGAWGLLVFFLSFAVIHLWRANQALHKQWRDAAKEHEKRLERTIDRLSEALNNLEK